ncbi:hypothetical protein DFH28DRAFT_341796 [Melampsora americana]|nr:hypothetical protein DFH28DRAFT_341796 [Melampsora americana]
MAHDRSERTFSHGKVMLHNLQHSDEPTPELTRNGYTISTRELPSLPYLIPFSKDYTKYLKDDSIQLIEELTGSSKIFCYGASHTGGPATESKEFVPIIHSDLSPEGAKYWTQELKEHYHYSLTDSDEFQKAVVDEKCLVIFNVWRLVQIVKDNPLAICDWKSLKKTDALNLKFTPTDLNNAQQAWKYAAHQKWGYVPNQKPKEVFVFIQHDSHGKDGHGMNVLHASVVLEGQQGTFTRKSYEFRIAVIMDNESLMEEEPAMVAKPVKEEQSVKENASAMEEEPPMEDSNKQGFLHKLVSCFFPQKSTLRNPQARDDIYLTESQIIV